MSEKLECVWCKEAGCDPEEYQITAEEVGGYCNESGLPICEGCADVAAEEEANTAQIELPPSNPAFQI